MQGYTTIENNQVQYTESLVFAASGPLSVAPHYWLPSFLLIKWQRMTHTQSLVNNQTETVEQLFKLHWHYAEISSIQGEGH